MTARALRDLLNRVELPDPHEFATAYVHHTETRRAARLTPMPVVAAVQCWLSLGVL